MRHAFAPSPKNNYERKGCCYCRKKNLFFIFSVALKGVLRNLRKPRWSHGDVIRAILAWGLTLQISNWKSVLLTPWVKFEESEHWPGRKAVTKTIDLHNGKCKIQCFGCYWEIKMGISQPKINQLLRVSQFNNAVCLWTRSTFGVKTAIGHSGLWLTFIWWADLHKCPGRVWWGLENWLQLALFWALPLGGTPDLTCAWCWSCCFRQRGWALVCCWATGSGSVGNHNRAGIDRGWAAGCWVWKGWCCRLSHGAGPRGGAAATHRARFHQEEATTVLRGCADGKK